MLSEERPSISNLVFQAEIFGISIESLMRKHPTYLNIIHGEEEKEKEK